MKQDMTTSDAPQPKASFRHFFFRGLGILLPTVLTIWLVVLAYNFVDQKIARHINTGVRVLVLKATPWPEVTDEQIANAEESLSDEQRKDWIAHERSTERLTYYARLFKLEKWWSSVQIGGWPVMNLIGLFIALFIIYLIGRLLGGYIGRRMYEQGERLLMRLPIFKQVYPYVKQVTDFFVGDKDDKLQFSKVVAVQYPRQGLWSIGLVTGETMNTIQGNAGRDCITVFIPSSPTPFTGYVITVPVEDTVEVAISIDDALRFCVSGGVIVPESQVIRAPHQPESIAVSQPVSPGAGEEAAKTG